MNVGVAQHKTRHIVGEIDIQLWAREQRRRWFARTCGASLRKFALRSWVMLRRMARSCARRLLQAAALDPAITPQLRPGRSACAVLHRPSLARRRSPQPMRRYQTAHHGECELPPKSSATR
jgi:hypothetical protein